jgi:hypothetical protein
MEGPPHRDCDGLNTGRVVLWLGDGQLGCINIQLRWWVPTSRFRHRSLSWGPEAVECGSYVAQHSNADVDGACHPEEAVDCAVVVEANG